MKNELMSKIGKYYEVKIPSVIRPKIVNARMSFDLSANKLVEMLK